MQPDDQKSYQDTSPDPGGANGPVVTLSPEPSQSVETVYPADDQVGPHDTQSSLPDPVRWRATEYVHRERDVAWYGVFVFVTLALMALAYFVIDSKSFTLLVLVMAAALFVYTRHPPRMLDYTLSRHGLSVNDQMFPYGNFKSFALMMGPEQHSIMLIPTKRFKPAITINFPDEAGEAIVDALASRLPMKEVEPDLIDRIIRKLHL